MHLFRQVSTYKGTTYTYYSIARSYRDETGRVRKEIVCRLGRLSDSEANAVRQILATQQDEDAFVATLDDLFLENQWSYLDVVFLHHLWEEWGLSGVFPPTTRKVPTSHIAEVLVLNRCLAPGSKREAIDWLPTTVLPWLLDLDPKQFSLDTVYRGLDVIEQQKTALEEHLIRQVGHRDAEGMHILFYDLTASYFEGRSCSLSKPGRAKANGFKANQIVLALVVNEHGYPLMWDVFKGATADVTTVEELIKKCERRRLARSGVTLVFDRGMVSDANLKAIDDAGLKYISAMDRDQIPGIAGATLESFKDLDVKDPGPQLKKHGFTVYDDSLYYRDLGVIKNRRYVLGLNPDRLREERSLRQKLLKEAHAELMELNAELAAAVKSRGENATAKKVQALLHRKNVSQLMTWSLEPVTVKHTTTGKKSTRDVSTFRVNWSQCEEQITKKRLLDGTCLFVSNHAAQTMTPDSMISAYRRKNEVETAFREIKSFLDLRPIFVRTDDHVKAHYTICVLAYLLNVIVRNRVRANRTLKNRHPATLYAQLRCPLVELVVKGTDEKRTRVLQTITEQQKSILKELCLEGLVKKSYVNKIISAKSDS